jgi:formate/nitrite transporter
MSDTPPPIHVDAYTPPQMAALVESVGIRKADLPALQTATLGLLAGAFIAFGAMFYTLVMTGSGLGFGPARLLGGVAFSLGLILVVVGGAELFTGNSLIVMAWAGRKIGTAALLRNWTLVYAANFAGALGTVVLVYFSGLLELGGGSVGETAAAIAAGKLRLGFLEAFTRGILCNVLVCLAVWLCFAAHDVAGKILAILFPITAFVALGFEHSVANMYLIPVGLLNGAEGGLAGLVANLVPVTLGNIIGGAGGVALSYWAAYRRSAVEAGADSASGNVTDG